jgi:hypothetical protein
MLMLVSLKPDWLQQYTPCEFGCSLVFLVVCLPLTPIFFHCFMELRVATIFTIIKEQTRADDLSAQRIHVHRPGAGEGARFKF